MKRFFSIILFIAFTISFASCATVQTELKKENEVAGYNLKSKKEQMQQKILHKKNKTLIACP
jgi:predicted amino acid-binding ACT domain protein